LEAIRLRPFTPPRLEVIKEKPEELEEDPEFSRTTIQGEILQLTLDRSLQSRGRPAKTKDNPQKHKPQTRIRESNLGREEKDHHWTDGAKLAPQHPSLVVPMLKEPNENPLFSSFLETESRRPVLNSTLRIREAGEPRTETIWDQPAWADTGAPIYDVPPPPFQTKTRSKEATPAGSYTISWFRSLSNPRPIIRGTQSLKNYQEVIIDGQKVKAVIDEGITVGISTRSFLATVAAYLPRIPLPVTLVEGYDVPFQTGATYINIRSQVQGVTNHCLHPILIAPSLGGEKLVLGTAYLRENYVEGFEAYLKSNDSNASNPQNIPPEWWQAAQDQVNAQYHYTTSWQA